MDKKLSASDLPLDLAGGSQFFLQSNLHTDKINDPADAAY